MNHDNGFIWHTPRENGRNHKIEPVFPGKTSYGRIGTLGYCRISAPAHITSHSSCGAIDRRWLKLLLQISGESELFQNKSHVTLRSGTWCVYDQARDFSIFNHTRVDQMVMLLPRDRLFPDQACSEAFETRIMGRNGGAESVLLDLLISIIKNLPDQNTATMIELCESIIALVRTCLSGQSSPEVRSSWNARCRERVLSLITFNLSRADLSIETIAKEVGCSKRQIHRLFGEYGTTCASYIRDARLDRCKADLLNCNEAYRSITDIAYAWGFSSSAHFSNAFRRRFGVSPRQMRASRNSSNAEAASKRSADSKICH